jgi:hypothetical protein
MPGLFLGYITPFTPLQAAGMAAITVLMGFLGGLVLSAVKRKPGREGLGDDDPGSRRHDGQNGFGELRRAHFFSSDPVFLYALNRLEHVLAAVDRDVGAGNERRFLRR